MTRLEVDDSTVMITELADGIRTVEVQPRADLFVPLRTCRTSYPVELIRLILDVKGPAYLCDEISRDVNPAYVQRDLEADLLAYFTAEALADKYILDFGCGSGASTMVLARLFPGSQIVGVELEESLLRVARARLAHYGYSNVTLHLSPSGDELPDGLPPFNLVVLSAVYEHMLPLERRVLLPRIWSTIATGGALFINMTPHRYFPIEHHTTGLPFLNYMPPSLALAVARRFSRRIDPTEPWETLLRRGIRGGTEQEILAILRGQPGGARLMEPSQRGLADRVDLWYSALSQARLRLVKKGLRAGLKVLRSLTGVTLVPNLSLAIRKVD